MSVTVGTRLGSYEILSLIGQGGMGQVYRARDSRLNREVAIKVLPADVAADHDRLARFESIRGDLTLSQPRQLFEQGYVFQTISIANYDVSVDGRRLLMVKDAGAGRLNMVLNWFEELKARVPTK